MPADDIKLTYDDFVLFPELRTPLMPGLDLPLAVIFED